MALPQDNTIPTLPSAQPAPQIQTSQTASLQQMIAARQGQVPAQQRSNIAAPSLAEQVSVGKERAASSQIEEQRHAQEMQLNEQQKSQQLEESLKTKEFNEKKLNIRSQFQRQVSQILTEFTQQGDSLNLQKESARVEQAGFLLRLQNEQYVDRLLKEGSRSRLQNDYNFKMEMNKAVFADEESLLQSSLSFRSMLAADNRTFAENMQNINLDQALAIANANAVQANTQQIVQGAAGIVSGGVLAYTLSTPSTSAATSNNPNQLNLGVNPSATATPAPMTPMLGTNPELWNNPTGTPQLGKM